jgi:hypothetical protein
MTPLSRWTPALMLAASLATGCRATTNLQVLQPALVTVPPEVQTLGVIDRSAAKNIGESLLGVLEGALTGESIGADRDGAREALSTLTMTLSKSPRFKVVTPNVNAEQAKSDITDTKLDWPTAERICKNAGCDALVVLEAIDSDTTLNITQQLNTTLNVTEYVAQRDAKVLTAWRVYDVKNKVILDEKRDYDFTNSWTERDQNKDVAVSRLPTNTVSVVRVAARSGDAYAGRIAPTYRWVARDFYVAGDDRLKEAKHHVRAQDWEGAAKIWTTMTDIQDPKLRGKAKYNLALYYERAGNLKQSYTLAQEAAVDLHTGRSRTYVDVINQRVLDAARLDEQMRVALPETKTEPEKRKPGRTLKPK